MATNQFNSFDVWGAEAQRRGFEVEPGGDGKLYAHLDGDEMGVWDPRYGGAGFGWFH